MQDNNDTKLIVDFPEFRKVLNYILLINVMSIHELVLIENGPR